MHIRSALSKVPEVTAYFWIIKILTTGIGETTSDFLVTHIDPVLGVALGAIGLVAAMTLQFMTRRYVPWVYWLNVVMVAIFGTMAADVVHIVLGIPYLISSIFFAAALIVIFALWYKTEHTLSIQSIVTVRREIFYWATVLATFALGTAVGDMTATTLHLGYFSSGILFTLLIGLVTLFRYQTVLSFWLAYILTRPLGASFADWMGVSHARGGLAWGTGYVSLALLLLIVGLVLYITVTRVDIKKAPHH